MTIYLVSTSPGAEPRLLVPQLMLRGEVGANLSSTPSIHTNIHTYIIHECMVSVYCGVVCLVKY